MNLIKYLQKGSYKMPFFMVHIWQLLACSCLGWLVFEISVIMWILIVTGYLWPTIAFWPDTNVGCFLLDLAVALKPKWWCKMLCDILVGCDSVWHTSGVLVKLWQLGFYKTWLNAIKMVTKTILWQTNGANKAIVVILANVTWRYKY